MCLLKVEKVHIMSNKFNVHKYCNTKSCLNIIRNYKETAQKTASPRLNHCLKNTFLGHDPFGILGNFCGERLYT